MRQLTPALSCPLTKCANFEKFRFALARTLRDCSLYTTISQQTRTTIKQESTLDFETLLKELTTCDLGDWQAVWEIMRYSPSSTRAILSTSARGAIEPYPVPMNPESGFSVRPFLAGPRFKFWNEQSRSQDRREIIVDRSISIDSNVAQYIMTFFFEGEKFDKDPHAEKARAALKQLASHRAALRTSIDWMLFLMENMPHAPHGERVRQTIAAIHCLDSLWQEAFNLGPAERRGKAENFLAQADLDIAEFHQNPWMLEAPGRAAFKRALLLKSFELKHSCKRPQEMLKGLLDFMLKELKCYAEFEMRLCWKYFCGEKIAFFDPFKPSSKSWALEAKAKAMAWDLELRRKLETFATVARNATPELYGALGDFFLPLIASTDTRFSKLLEAMPVKLIVFDHEAKRSQSFLGEELKFSKLLDGVMSEFSKNELTPVRIRERVIERQLLTESRLVEICAGLEAEIGRVLGGTS